MRYHHREIERFQTSRMAWDEENRLLALSDNGCGDSPPSE
jgi:hypothetical protein